MYEDRNKMVDLDDQYGDQKCVLILNFDFFL